MTDLQTIARQLSEAQRVIMLGQLIDIPPEETDALQAMGLKGEAYWHENGEGRRMVWPITDLGLSLRAYLMDTPHPQSDSKDTPDAN